jgi:hypothetical protein
VEVVQELVVIVQLELQVQLTQVVGQVVVAKLEMVQQVDQE